jgi:hypothetical protein
MKRQEARKKMLNYEFHNLHPVPNIIRVMKSEMTRQWKGAFRAHEEARNA